MELLGQMVEIYLVILLVIMVAPGTQTAGLNIGGTLHPNTKQVKTLSYNGTAWSEVADLSTAGNALGGAGASAFFTYDGSSSSLAFGGYTRLASTEEFTA